MRRGCVRGASLTGAALLFGFVALGGTAPASRAEAPPAQGADDAPHARHETAVDRQISEKIRQAITNDDSFSTRAKSVSVVTSDGVVTLRGAVPNEQERSALVAKARGVAGVVALDDRLEAVAR
ncbi:MAG TPA: BON domain-containing protein [Candidatus Binatia bacterium]|jgi:osmotically-inducible protein OsmY